MKTGVVRETRSAVTMTTGSFINHVLSFIVFSVLDLVDLVLCYVYRVIDYIIEAEWKPCYCSSSSITSTSSGINILVSEKGESKKIICLASSSTKLQLEEISDTLYTRPSFIMSEVSKSTVNELKLDNPGGSIQYSFAKRRGSTLPSTFTLNSTIVEMLQEKIGRGSHRSNPNPRWSDCDCPTCSSWSSSSKDRLFVHAQGPKDNVEEDVVFIHGFISSSAFWTETLFPNFSKTVKTRYRLFAMDLLGFGRSPKPAESLYTIREHIEMIERSVMEGHKVKSFHIVAHSLGCLLALALAVKHPASVKSLTLIAPPYFPPVAPKKGEVEGVSMSAAQYMMRKVAPRRVWPLIGFGASLACWYEHVSRTICLVICKNHRLWEFLTKFITRNRIRTYLIQGFCCHTHNSAWHTLHNVICGSAPKIEGYLDFVNNHLNCQINIFHGQDDELIPVECSYNLQKRVPRALVKVIENKDHITIVVGRQQAFARELEKIWKNTASSAAVGH